MSGGFLGGNGAWGTDGNWSDGAAKPVVNDLAIIGSTLGSNNVSDAGGTANAIDLNLLLVDKGYTGTFGTSAAPIRCSADLIQFIGGRGIYYECDDGAGGLKCDRMEIMVGNSSVPVEIGSTTGDQGNYDSILALRGNISIKANTLFTDTTGVLEVGMIASPNDVRLSIATGADTLPILRQYAGLVEADNAITAADVGHGAKLVKDNAAITTLRLWGHCDCNYGAGTTGTVVITTAYVYPGGVLDLTQKSQYKTITSLYVYPGARVLYNANIHTITNLYDYSGGTAMVAA